MKKLPASVLKALGIVHEAASSKLAKEPVALDIRESTTMADVIYVCHADSGRAVDAVAEEIVKRLREGRVPIDHVEGFKQQQWVLIDLGAMLVHVFLRDRRDHYSLERLWHDGHPIQLPPP
jgi:ribosome-associated protein